MGATLLARAAGAALGCLIVGLPGAAVFSTPAYPSPATPPPNAGTYVVYGDRVKGAALFAENCVRCHGAKGTGSTMAPPLKDQLKRKGTAATIYWIKFPQPPMPKLYPQLISDRDVNDIVAYLESL